MDLTEDRTFRHQFIVAKRVAQAIVNSDNAEIIIAALTVNEEHWEHKLDYELASSQPVSGTFMRVAADLKASGRPMVPGARKLFTQRARETSTYGEARVRSATPVEIAHFREAVRLLQTKMPNFDVESCAVTNDTTARNFILNRGCIEMQQGCADLSVMDLAVKVLSAMVTGDSVHSKADLITKMFLLGTYKETGHLEEDDGDGLPF
jgi:hypothetical protein